MPQVRGGGELGSAWHLAGKRMRKLNSPIDFLAAADALCGGAKGCGGRGDGGRGGGDRGKVQYTSHDRLAAWGRSAGGITVGAAINLRPDAFRAAVLDVPFLDVLSTMSDPSLPLVHKVGA